MRLVVDNNAQNTWYEHLGGSGVKREIEQRMEVSSER